MQQFGGLEKVVFVVLFDDPQFFRVVQRTEMNGRGIDGGGDVHEFQTKRSAGKQELPNIAYQGDIGVVHGDVQVGLIVQARGLLARAGAAGLFLL